MNNIFVWIQTDKSVVRPRVKVAELYKSNKIKFLEDQVCFRRCRDIFFIANVNGETALMLAEKLYNQESGKAISDMLKAS